MLYDRSYLDTSSSLGIRNNNPGNIEKSPSEWVGKIVPSKNSRFEQFISMGLGTRALMVDLRGKIGRGLNTIAKIVPVWAPATENDVVSYIAAVEASSGINRNAIINKDDPAQVKALARAMAKHETGQSLDPRFFDTAWALIDSAEARKHAAYIAEFGGGEFGGGGASGDWDLPDNTNLPNKGNKKSTVLIIVLVAIGIAIIYKSKK